MLDDVARLLCQRGHSNVELLMDQDGKSKQMPMTPFSNTNYKPELGTSPLLDASMMSRYQQLIGILRWSCELGCLDILLEVSLLSVRSMQHLVRAILMHCTISSATLRRIQVIILHLILRYLIMMLNQSNQRARKNSMKLLVIRYLRMHLSHVGNQWRWLVLLMHLMPPIRSLTDLILGFSFCWIHWFRYGRF